MIGLLVVLLDNNLRGHRRVDRAVVRVGAGRRELVGERAVGVDRARGIALIRSGDRVRDVVVVGPGHGRAGRDRQRRRREAEVVDRDLSLPRLARRSTACRRHTAAGSSRDLAEIEGVGEPSGRGIASPQRRQSPALLDQLEDRGAVVLRMIDKALLGVGRDDQGRHARARPPAVARGRGDVIPEPAILVIGDDDRGIGPGRALLHRLHQIGHVLLAARQVGIAGVFVVGAGRLDKRNGRQGVVVCRAQKVLFVVQVRGLAGRSIAVFGDVGEWLVIELEQRIGVPGRSIVPAAREPAPRDAVLVEAVADRRQHQRRHELRRVGDRRGMWPIRRERRVHQVAVGGDRAVLDERAVGADLCDHAGRGVGPVRRRGGDQPEVVQQRAAEGRVKEVVGQRVLLGQLAFGQDGGVVVAQRQSSSLILGHELIHLAAVDLLLLLVEALGQVANQLVRRDELIDVERPHGQVSREARVGAYGLLVAVFRLRQCGVRLILFVELRDRRAVVGDAFGARELTVQAVEALVLLHDHHNVVELVQPARVGHRGGRRTGCRRHRGGDGRYGGRCGRGRLRAAATRRQDGQHEHEQQRREDFPSSRPVHWFAPFEQRVLGQLLLSIAYSYLNQDPHANIPADYVRGAKGIKWSRTRSSRIGGVEASDPTADRTTPEMCIRSTHDTQEGRRVQEKTQQLRFEQIVLPHLDAAYNLARWLTRNDQDAEDVVQEACLRAFKFFGGFYGGDSRAWLLTIVRNTCYTWLRHNRAHELTTPFDETIHDVECEALNPEAQLLHHADQQLLRRALEALPVEFREVVVLRELEQLSYKEIGVIADIPLGTVMSRLARARKRLQHDLAKRWNGED